MGKNMYNISHKKIYFKLSKYLKDNPELIQQLDQPFKVRPNLPNKIDFIKYYIKYFNQHFI